MTSSDSLPPPSPSPSFPPSQIRFNKKNASPSPHIFPPVAATSYFTNLEEDLRKIDILNAKASFEVILKALVDLEKNGFGVGSLRSRMKKLLEIRNSYNKFQRETTTMKEQTFEREFEKDKLARIIKELDKQIADLIQQRVSLIQQKNNESEIAKLEKNMQAFKSEPDPDVSDLLYGYHGL